MQKLWLKNFEFHINPNTWNTAQDLVRAGAVRHLQEVEKHFWVAGVSEEDQRVEVEIMITPHKIKAYTCECWSERRRLMCPHIAAVLFKIRQFLEQKAEDRQSRSVQEKPEKPGRLTVQSVLARASGEHLAEFVRIYAQKDRDFALALKTWFAGQIEGPENPFVLLLEAALPRHAGVRSLRDPEIRRLRKTLDDLEGQIVEAHKEANGHTVFQISTALLEKITPLLARLEESRRAPIAQYCQNALQHLLKLEAEHLSPELREKRREFLLHYLLATDHFPVAERLLVPFLSRAATDDRFFDRINARFQLAPHPVSPVLLHLFLAALAARKRPEAVLRVLQDYSALPGTITTALTALFYDHYWTAVLVAGDHFLESMIFNPGQTRLVEDLLLTSAEKAEDQIRLLTYLRRRYRQYGSPEVFNRLKSVAGPHWPEERDKLSAELREKGDSGKLVLLLATEGDLDRLANLLAAPGQLDLLQRYEHLFLPERYVFVRDYYVAELTQYLKDHFGRQGSGHVREKLAVLLRKNEVVLVKEIISILVSRFPDRHTLPEELAELFPKAKRPEGVQGDGLL